MRNSPACLLAFVVACGGGTAEGPKGTSGAGSGSNSKSAPAGDVSIDVPAIEIKGLVFEPLALGRPGLPLYEPKRKTTIDKQRAAFAATKNPVEKEAQAAILQTLLYQKSKDVQGEEQQKLLGEARQALRDAAALSGDKVDDVTLRLLGSYELMLDPNYPAAEKAWAALVDKAPKDKDILYNRAWWAYTLLKQYKNAEAVAVVMDQPITEKQPELAYVAAWAKLRTGDNAGAWQAILTAAKGWGNSANKDVVDRDVLLFAGRTDVSLDDALKALVPLYAKSAGALGKTEQYELLAKLGLQSYQFAGRWKDGVAAIDKAIQIEADKVPPNDLPVLRYTQADYTVRLDDPVTGAKLALQAIDALPACGAKCSDSDKENVVESVYIMGRLFHILYANAHDDRYYQPAHDLYAAALQKIVNSDVRKQATEASDYLERTFKAMRATDGKHDKDAIGALLNRHNQEVQACYEQGLLGNAKLDGTLVLTLESDQTGVIKGAATEPKGGLQDMALVASCVATHAKSWNLPKRANANGPTGSTRITLTYKMQKKEAAPAATAANGTKKKSGAQGSAPPP